MASRQMKGASNGRLAGKVAIVTGSNLGMGRATVELFLREGARVVGVDIAPPKGAQRDIETFVFDVAEESGWQRMVAEVQKSYGRIDVLVNNAGFSRRAPITEYPAELFRRTMDVNVLGTFLGIKSVVPLMKKRRSGSIINISSVDGLRPSGPNRSPYVASKWAVRGMTKSLAIELAEYGIRVNSVHPGAIDTPMLRAGGGTPAQIAKDLDVTFGRVGEASEVAAASLFLASDEASYISGAELAVDGAWSAGKRSPGRPNWKPGADGKSALKAPSAPSRKR